MNKGKKEQQNKGTKEQRNKGTKKQKVHPIGSGITRSPGLVSEEKVLFQSLWAARGGEEEEMGHYLLEWDGTAE